MATEIAFIPEILSILWTEGYPIPPIPRMYHPKVVLSNGSQIVFLEKYSRTDTLIAFNSIFGEIWSWVDETLPRESILEFSFVGCSLPFPPDSDYLGFS